MTTYSIAMTTTQKPTALGAGILEAMKLSGASQTDMQAVLGMSYNTWRKRLAGDGFTMQELMRISGRTGISLGAIIPANYLTAAAA